MPNPGVGVGIGVFLFNSTGEFIIGRRKGSLGAGKHSIPPHHKANLYQRITRLNHLPVIDKLSNFHQHLILVPVSMDYKKTDILHRDIRPPGRTSRIRRIV
jgi:hypothetical protein